MRPLRGDSETGSLMTADDRGRPLDASQLERILQQVEPRAFLVPPRILRRLIKNHLGLGRLGVQVPHRDVYAVASKDLLEVVEGSELGLRQGTSFPSVVFLLERPTSEELASVARSDVLRDYWRLLFHARIHACLDPQLAPDHLVSLKLQHQLARLSDAEVSEIETVLKQEGLITANADRLTTLIEFAAYYLELKRFAPTLLPRTFPGLDNPQEIETILAGLVQDESLFHATFLPGASAPLTEPMPRPGDHLDETPVDSVEWEIDPNNKASSALIQRAEQVAARGNLVRAAILKTQAGRQADSGPRDSEPVSAGAKDELFRLVQRLQRALGFDGTEAERWRRALPPLLARSARGFWTPEARLLYDLQKVCVDHEREVFRMDLVGWVISFGRRPLRRVQPYLREVMTTNHLRSASRRLVSTRLPNEERARLATVLQAAVESAEHTLRERLRGPIDATLTTSGFKPRNLPERVAYRKLIDELLDRIASRGFITLGDLRDTCSRNNLKLADLSGPREFLQGDLLLRVDRALARSLDGVYRRGEVYLRWLQRFSSLAFATSVGRFLTSYVALPYGGAFLILEGLQHIVEAVVHHLGGEPVHLMNLPSTLILGTVALGILDFPTFRSGFLKACRLFGRVFRMILFDTLAWLLRHPLLRLLFESRWAQLTWRWLIKPAAVTSLVWLAAHLLHLDEARVPIISAVAFACASFLMNTKLGRTMEEILADEVVRAWKQLYRDIVPGVYRLIVGLFDWILETVDRFLYAVDEWLRFRSGQNRVLLSIKSVLGAVWLLVAYIVRFYVNLLIEPQVNPIKHFPVVTVSHKIILPFTLTLTRILAAPLLPIFGKVIANFIAGSTVVLLPGVFGFLVWEFKENYRLYRANRRETLGPIAVGSHGETIARLLRPGLHSGTLPKLFGKLRRSEARWLNEGRVKAILKREKELHHVEEAVTHFIEREFLALLHETRTLGNVAIELESVALATNRIRFGLAASELGTGVVRIEFLESEGRLSAQLTDPGWLTQLPPIRRQTMATALIGLYKLSAIDDLQVRALDDARELPAKMRSEVEAPRVELIPFEQVRVTWKAWVEAWERKLAANQVDSGKSDVLGLGSTLILAVLGEEARPMNEVREFQPSLTPNGPRNPNA